MVHCKQDAKWILAGILSHLPKLDLEIGYRFQRRKDNKKEYVQSIQYNLVPKDNIG